MLRFTLDSGGLIWGAWRINFVGPRLGRCSVVLEVAEALANRDQRRGGRRINYRMKKIIPLAGRHSRSV